MSKKKKPQSKAGSSGTQPQEKFGSSLASQLRQVKGRSASSTTEGEHTQSTDVSSRGTASSSTRGKLPTAMQKAMQTGMEAQSNRISRQVAETSRDEEDIDLEDLWNPRDESESAWLQWAGAEVQKLSKDAVPARGSKAGGADTSRKASARDAETRHREQQFVAEQEAMKEAMKEAMAAEFARLQELWQQEKQLLQQEQSVLQQESLVLREEVSLLRKKCGVLEQELSQSTVLCQNIQEQWHREKQQWEQKSKVWESATGSPIAEVGVLDDTKKTSVSSLLTQRGVPTGQESEALQVLASRLSSSLLRHLYADPTALGAWLRRHLVLCCEHPDCEAAYASAPSTVVLLRVQDPSLCEQCQGSETLRAVRQMLRSLRKYQKNKVVIIGGSPDAHAELQRMVPQGFDLRLVDGTERRFKQQAADDLRYSDLVVIWGPTILLHRTSDLYTQQKSAFPDKLLRVHKRGLTAFARSLCALLEGKEQDSDTEENTE